MMKFIRLILFVLFFFLFSSRFPVFSQNCPITDIVGVTDVISVERAMEDCVEYLPEWETILTNNLQSSSLSSATATLHHIYLGFIDSSYQDYYEASLHFQNALGTTGDAESRHFRHYVHYYYALMLLERSGRVQAVYDNLESARSLAESIGDSLITGRVYQLRGRFDEEDGLSIGARDNYVLAIENYFAVPAASVQEQIEALYGLSRMERAKDHFRLANLYGDQAQNLEQNSDLYDDFLIEETLAQVPAGNCILPDESSFIAYLTFDEVLQTCLAHLATLQADVDVQLSNTTDASQRANLQIISGLLNYAAGNYLDAHTIHGRALGTYQNSGQLEMQALVSYFMGRSYEQRRQDAFIRTYYDSAFMLAEDYPYIQGLARLAYGRYLLNESTELHVSEEYLENALEKLSESTSPTISMEQEREIFILLEQVLRQSGQTERANQYAGRLANLSSDAVVEEHPLAPVSQYDISSCENTTLFGQTDPLLIERIMQACPVERVAGLMLTARVIQFASDNPATQALGQTFYGIGQYVYGNYLEAQSELGAAILILNEVDVYNILGASYIYLIISYHDDDKDPQAQRYYPNIMDTLSDREDYLSFYYLHEYYRVRGDIFYDEQQLQAAVEEYETAFRYLEESAIPSREQARFIAGRLVNLNQRLPDSEVDAERWRTELNNINAEDGVSATAIPTEIPSGTPIPPALDCSVDSLIALTDLVIIDERLSDCSTRSLGAVLSEVERRQFRVGEDISLELFYLNYEGLIHYNLGVLTVAGAIQDDALEVANNNILNPIQEGLAYFFYGRTRLELDPPDAPQYFELADLQTRGVRNDIISALIKDVTGRFDISEGRVDNGVRQLEEAIALYDSTGYPSKALASSLVLGNLALQRSEFAKAHEAFNDALIRVENLNDPISTALALIGNVRYYKYRGNYDLAESTLDELDMLDIPASYQALVTAERADVARLQLDYIAAESLIEPIYQNRRNFTCDVADIISLYRGYYLTDIGDRTTALRTLDPLVELTGCPARNAVMVSMAYNAVSEAYLQFGIVNIAVREAVDDAVEFAQDANEVNTLNVRGSYPRGYQLSYIHRARFNISQARYNEAFENLEVAEASAEVAGDVRMLAEVNLVRVDVALKQANFNDAIAYLDDATNYFIAINHDTAILETFERAVQIYLNQGNYSLAQEFIESAGSREGIAALPLAFQGLINFYRGQSLEQQGFTTDASELYDEARALFDEAGDIFNVFAVDLQTIRLAHRLGDYEGALERIGLVAQEIEALRNNPSSTGGAGAEATLLTAQLNLLSGDNKLLRWLDNPTLRNQFPLNLAESDYANALQGFIDTADVGLQSNSRCEGVPIDARVAEAYNRLGALRVAVLQYNFALNVRRQGNHDLDLAICIYDVLENTYGRSEARYNLGRFYLFADNTLNYTRSIEFFNAALELIPESDPYRRAQIYTHIGLAYEYNMRRNNTLDLQNAIAAYENAANLLSFAYAEIGDANTQRTFGFRLQTLVPYNRLILLYGNNPQLEDYAVRALSFAEQSRARSYLTQLQGTSTQLNVDNEDARRWLELRSEIANLQTRRDVAEEDRAVELQAEIDIRRTEIDEVEQHLDDNILNQLLTVNVASHENIDDAVNSDTALVAYYIIKDNINRFEATTNIVSFVITNPDGDDANDQVSIVVNIVPVINRDVTPGDLGQVDCDQELETQAYCAEIRVPISRIQNSSADVIRDVPVHQELYEWLIEPIEAQIDGFNSLVIVPHSDLHYLPFEILQDADNPLSDEGNPLFLFDKFNSISYVPSVTVYTLLQDIPERSEIENALLLGYSGEVYGERALQEIDDEIEQALEYFDRDRSVWQIGDEANRDFLFEQLDYNVIHLAAHGLFNSSNPLDSEILLAPYFNDDGSYTFAQLTVRDIYELSFQDSNPLVVISACQLANNQVNPGDELEGFTRAFLLSGARGIVASLWDITDSRASEFVEIFYRYRFDGMTNAEALTAAKRTMRDLHPDEPDTWFAFILSGQLN